MFRELFKWPFSKPEAEPVVPETVEVSAPKDWEMIFNCQVDFLAMKAFSIERQMNGRFNLTTVIGYVHEGKIKEWTLQTTDAIHTRLVAEFTEVLRLREETRMKHGHW